MLILHFLTFEIETLSKSSNHSDFKACSGLILCKGSHFKQFSMSKRKPSSAPFKTAVKDRVFGFLRIPLEFL